MLGWSVVVLAGSAWFGWWLERTREPPRGDPVGIELVTSDILAENGPGYAVAVYVDVHSCRNPAHVTVQAAATADLWRRHVRGPEAGEWDLPVRSTVAVGISDPAIKRLKLVPIYGDASKPGPVGGVRPSFKAAGFHPGRAEVGPYGGAGIVGFFDRWQSTWWAVAATFDADWVSARDFESCYVRLPALTGFAANLGGDPAFNAAQSNGYYTVTSFGSTHVAGDGRVASDLSEPAPNDVRTSTWTCEDVGTGAGAPGVQSPALVANKSGNNALRLHDYRRSARLEGGCDAIAVVERPGRAALRDLLFLVAGAGIALGMSLIAEVVIRHERRPTPADVA